MLLCALSSWLKGSDSAAPFRGHVRPVGAIDVGPKMEPPQQQVMYDLVGFLVWAGGNEASSARFRTYSSAPCGTWYCFMTSMINSIPVDHASQAALLPQRLPDLLMEGCGCSV